MGPGRVRGGGAVSEATSYQRLREHLAYLGLTTAEEHLSVELDRALAEQLSATQVLERLLELGHEAPQARRLRGRLRFARYPIHKTLADFDFDFQPHLDRKLIAELSMLRFVEEHRNVVLLGPPGVGKTHLMIALRATTAAELQTKFIAVAREKNLGVAQIALVGLPVAAQQRSIGLTHGSQQEPGGAEFHAGVVVGIRRRAFHQALHASRANEELPRQVLE